MRNVIAVTVCGLLAASVVIPVTADAVVMCAKVKSSTGEIREGTPIKLRTVCRPNEEQLDPDALGLQGPPGDDGVDGLDGGPGQSADFGSCVRRDVSVASWAPTGSCEPGEVAVSWGMGSTGCDDSPIKAEPSSDLNSWTFIKLCSGLIPVNLVCCANSGS